MNRWSNGITEPGSSGSPLFSSDKLIVGQLHGEGSSCENRLAWDVYGGIWASYNSGLVASQRLIDWFNPTKDPRITKVTGSYLKTLRRKNSSVTTAGDDQDMNKNIEQEDMGLTAFLYDPDVPDVNVEDIAAPAA